jgi:hypothetical protein
MSAQPAFYLGKLNLDVDAPDKVAAVLRQAADAYNESRAELQSAWQEKMAGWEWAVIAKILDQAADKRPRTRSRSEWEPGHESTN